ncbi:MAG: SprT-like family-domain-containing protein [Benjaminiella poitrasii]|nr:MAG: SprT-like family-domain-containing protein [Benjaminiella poitrasii]
MKDQIALDESLAKELYEEEQRLLNMCKQDFELAKTLQNSESSSVEFNQTDDVLDETIPDLHELFMLFNALYFDHKLDMVEVKWSNRMTRCAGTCTFKTGGHCIVTLSEPLLKFRPKSDMIDTLLHEMIHALLFITQRNIDRDGHGPEFLYEANRINKLADTNITVYHSFHDEVDYYLTHVWQCNGSCRDKPPYFGIVKRSMNRPPQLADPWFADHQLTCEGTFVKIHSPEPTTKKRKTTQTNTLLNYFSDDKKQKQ